MNSKSMKAIIQRALEYAQFRKGFEKMVCGALTYSMLEQKVAANPSIQNQLPDLAGGYISQYRKFVTDLAGKYTCYTELELLIDGWGTKAFQDLTDPQIKMIVRIYNERKEIPAFSTTYYDSTMYGLGDISAEADSRLRRLHRLVFSPLVKHYRTFYGTAPQTISIKDIQPSKPGKVFSIKIADIPPSKILSDIQADVYGIKEYVYSAKLTPDDGVEVIIR